MPNVYLAISDEALRQAVLEQFAHMASFPKCDVGDFARMTTNAVDVMVADECALPRDFNSERMDNVKQFLLLMDGPTQNNKSRVEVFMKPVYLGHVLDRLQFHLNVMPRLRSAVLSFSGYRLETQNRQLLDEKSGEAVRLTEKETAILEHLAQNAKPVSRDDLLAAVWGYDGRIDTHTLETHIYQLRRKMDPAGTRGDVLCNDGNGYFLKQG